MPARRPRREIERVARARPRPARDAARPAARSRSRSTSSRPRAVDCGELPARAHRVRHRGDDVGARVPARAARRATEPGPAMLAIHGHGPGKSRVCGLERGARRRRRLRARARDARATSCSRPTCAASASAPTGCPTTSTTATGISCAPRWPASSRSSATSGICSARSTCSARTRSSTRRASARAGSRTARTCTLFLAALDERVRAAIVSRLPVVVAVGAHGPVEHVRLAGPARPARRDRARRRRRRSIAPRAAARRDRHRRHDLPGRRRRARRSRRCARVYAALGAPDDALVHDVFDGDHRWHGTEEPAFLERWL